MKKLFGSFLVMTLLGGLTGVFGVTKVWAAGAATIDLSGETSVEVGESIEIKVIVNPNSEALDTVRVNLSFPTDLLQVDHFSLGDLFSRSSPGNQVDNSEGKISEGAFSLSGPVTNSGEFGTVVFKAIKTGKATLKVLETSRLIAGGEEKIDTGNLGEKTITINDSLKSEDSETEIIISSLSHLNQNQWSNLNDVTFSWTSSEDIEKYEIALEQSLNTEPSQEVSATSVTLKDVEDGIWYFLIRGVLEDGTKTEVSNYKVMIDTVSPNAFFPTVDKEQLSEGENLTLYFGTTDELSGIVKYEVSVNDGDFEEKTSPVTIENLKAGNYFIEVRAWDAAENKIYGRTVARVYPAGVELPPVIAATPLTKTVETEQIKNDYSLEKKVALGVIGGGLILVFLYFLIKRQKNKFKKL